ncbi:MAG: nuclear transport factor 2 family protein [Pyrinomonadaceae bacterium]|nr:nuclear transport factor 2 family protein [Pyrinomonadaceae bacterium]
MKKSFAVVLLLALAAACAAPPTNNETAPTNSAATKPAAVAISEADVIAKEKAIWDTIKNKDYDGFGNMLAEDQMEVLPDGIHDKAGSIAGVKEFEPTEVVFSNWKYLPIDKDAVVILYHVDVKAKYKGKESPPQSARASSVWVNRNGKWLATFHQECEASTAPPPPAPKSGTAKASASPASAASPLPPGADPIATEKALWETLKNKDYDGFAAFLAPEAIEIEPSGVYDRAGSIKGVSEVDLSKAQLSEFKSVAFDQDAAVVTYTVKLPGSAPAERHSTIWAKRDGKWLAMFHHGTPIPKGTPATAPSPKAAAATPSPK